MRSLVTARGVSFELPNGRLLFKNLNCSLTSQITALVGPNGIGKSCLAQLLSGILNPTEGEIRAEISVTYFPQHRPAPPFTVEEFLGFENSWSPFREKLLLNINRQEYCQNLSGGQWMRVRLAQCETQDYLVLDEPTNNLDREGRQAILDFIQNHHGGILLVSHDRECLRLCEVVLELSNRGLHKYGGGWDFYELAKNQERHQLQKSLESAKRNRESALESRTKLLKRQEKRNQKGSEDAARGGMPRIAMGLRKRQAQVTSGKVETSTLELAQNSVREAFEAYSNLKVEPIMYADLLGVELPSQKLVAEASGFNVQYQNWVFARDLEFCWRGNVRVALKGSNGSGKSTLLRTMQSDSLRTRGYFRRGQLTTLYLDQNCSQLEDSKSVFENVQEASSFSEGDLRNKLAQFLFTKDSVFQKVGSLSGGERMRAALACGLLSQNKPQLLLLDEPTNNLDLANIEYLENLVRQFQGAVILVSHDDVFLKNCRMEEVMVI